MPTFITYASYSHAGIKGLVSEPTDRTAAIKALIEKAGGKLIAAYMTTGSHDIMIIAEAPEGSDAVAASMAASASGHLANVETVRAWSLPEFKAIAEKAKTWLWDSSLLVLKLALEIQSALTCRLWHRTNWSGLLMSVDRGNRKWPVEKLRF